MRNLMIAAAVSAGLLITPAWADEAAEAAIHYRQSVFSAVKWHFGSMAAVVKGKAPFEAEAFAAHAQHVAALSRMALEGFPKGSDFGETKAKDAIWSHFDDFKTKMEAFTTEAEALAKVAEGGDLGAVKKQFGNTGKTCKSCHDDYKQD